MTPLTAASDRDYDAWVHQYDEPRVSAAEPVYQSGPVMDACEVCGASITQGLVTCLPCEQRRDDAFERFEDERREDAS